METTKNNEKILAIGVGAVAVLFLGNLIVVQPLIKKYHEREEKIATLTKQVQDGKITLRRETYILHRWSDMETNSLPPETQPAEDKMFRLFDSWVGQAGVTEGSFRPQIKDNPDDGYSTVECRADVTGNMTDLVNFLYDVESDSAAIRLDSVEITSRDDNGRQLTLVLGMSGLMLPNSTQQ